MEIKEEKKRNLILDTKIEHLKNHVIKFKKLLILTYFLDPWTNDELLMQKGMIWWWLTMRVCSVT